MMSESIYRLYIEDPISWCNPDRAAFSHCIDLPDELLILIDQTHLIKDIPTEYEYYYNVLITEWENYSNIINAIISSSIANGTIIYELETYGFLVVNYMDQPAAVISAEWGDNQSKIKPKEILKFMG